MYQFQDTEIIDLLTQTSMGDSNLCQHDTSMITSHVLFYVYFFLNLKKKYKKMAKFLADFTMSLNFS